MLVAQSSLLHLTNYLAQLLGLAAGIALALQAGFSTASWPAGTAMLGSLTCHGNE